MKANRLVLGVATATASILVLSGCTPSGDVAVKVGDETFTTADVDLLTDFQCSYLAELVADPANGGQVAAVSRQRARSDMASILVATALDEVLAERADVTVDPARVREPLEQLGPTIEKVASGEDRERLRALVTASIENSIAVSEIAGRLAQESGVEANEEQLSQALFALRTGEAKRAGVEIDPVFGLSDDGLTPGNDPSLSLTLSEFSQQATASPPDPALVDQLPANQRCG